jgi:hypothetical protein
MYRLYTNVIVPAIQNVIAGVSGTAQPGFIKDRVVDWATSLVPLLTYMKDFDRSIVSWEPTIEAAKKGQVFSATGNLIDELAKPDIWVRDSHGNKAYKVGGLQDRALLLMGIPPIAKTRLQVLKQGWKKETDIVRDNRRRWYDKVTKSLLEGKEISGDLWMDGLLYKIDPSQIPTAIKYKEMPPEMREILKTNLMDRADALDQFGLGE